jgi:osmotically-inducible protein OsmY
VTQPEKNPPPDAGIGGEGSPFDLTVLAPETDMEIGRGVRAAFALDSDIDDAAIDVRVENGVVTVSGPVRSESEHTLVLHAAEIVHGVRRVVDELER